MTGLWWLVKTNGDGEFKLLYDGQCPMCRREVKWLESRSHDGRLVFEDISQPDFDAAHYGLTQAEVMGVMHGVYPDGRVVTKVAAFREAYRRVGLGWLLAPTDWPLLRGISNWGYEWFARNRVAIGKLIGGPTCENGCLWRCAAEKAQSLIERLPVALDAEGHHHHKKQGDGP